MIITDHALQRIRERTKLSPDMVKDILEANACSFMGSSIHSEKTRKYFLFHSYSDGKCFVAVVDDLETSVITVLESNHGVPIKIKNRHFKEARKRWREYTFSKIVVHKPERASEIKEPGEVEFVATRLDVIVDGKIAFTDIIGTVPSTLKSNSEFMEYFKTSLEVVYDTISDWTATRIVRSLKYEIWVKLPNRPSYKRVCSFFHSELKKRLKKTQESP